MFNLACMQEESAPGQRVNLSECTQSREQHSSGSFQTSPLKGIIPHCFEDSQQEILTAASLQSCHCFPASWQMCRGITQPMIHNV